jgi:4-amino-4-deoxy-L-arabinose transferase-like glycosyltransferase
MKPNRIALYLVLILALALRLSWIALVPTWPVSDYGVFDKIAMNVATGHGYALTAGLPTTYRPPGYPLLLAGIYAVFGHSILAARLVNALLGVMGCFLTYVLASQLFDRRIGLFAALIVAGFPSYILHGNLLATENLFIPLLLGSLVTFLHAVQQEKARWAYWILSGALLGAAVLTRPAILLLPAVWGGVLLWQRVPLKQTAIAVLVIGGVMVATIAPWTVRNARVSGEFIPVATEGGITLLAGHNERALQAEYSLEGPVFDELHAKAHSEAELDRLAFQLAFRFIRNNPKTELLLLVHKFVNFFKDDVSGVEWNVQSALVSVPGWAIFALKGIAQAYYVAVVLLAITSLFFVRRFAQNHWYVILSALFIYWTAIHLAFYGKDRFRLPLMPVYTIFAAVALAALWDHHKRRFQQKNS